MIAKVSTFAHGPSRRRRILPPRSTHSAAPSFDERAKLFSAFDDNAYSFDPSHAATTTAAAAASATPPGITQIQSFEPMLNVQAAASFAFIAIAFAVLRLRIIAVSNAARRRSAALSALRAAESAQLSDPTAGGDQVATRARVEYESALREELSLRTIVPGVRIVAPNDPRRDEEERAAAKRFLGWGREEFGDDDEGVGIGTEGTRGSIERSDGNVRTDESDVGL
ncbi:hypothetical protein ACHAW5_007298 [Stephanodiscus triporus]|uniref:Uncharacterized protein n=1 Tax=Stephanodiscus triporus TaxID=2934178 RepID=A0ABD3NG23_9STRA